MTSLQRRPTGECESGCRQHLRTADDFERQFGWGIFAHSDGGIKSDDFAQKSFKAGKIVGEKNMRELIHIRSEEVLGTGRRHEKPISVFLILLILLTIIQALYIWIQID